MILKQTEENLREYDEFIQSCEKCNFSQSKMWANLKDNWKNEIVVSRDENGKIKNLKVGLNEYERTYNRAKSPKI